jgi:hypothetical protein
MVYEGIVTVEKVRLGGIGINREEVVVEEVGLGLIEVDDAIGTNAG